MHPATIYGFLLTLVSLAGMIVLVALGKVTADVGVPIIAGLGTGSSVVAGAFARTPVSVTTGTVGYVDPNA